MLKFYKFLLFNFCGFVVLMELLAFYGFVKTQSLIFFVLLCLIPYLVPLTTFRVLNYFWPLKEGRSHLQAETYSPWLAAYRIQLIYGLFPFFECALLAFPGLYSCWLRAWGSKIGRRVIWAATVTVTDRSHLHIGDEAFIGAGVYFSSHVVQDSKDKFLLLYKRITVGNNVFIGAGCRLGPGVVIKDKARVPILTDLYINETFPKVNNEVGAVETIG